MSSHYEQYPYYSHEIKQAIAVTGDIHLFPDLNIPKSTRRDWANKPAPRVVSVEVASTIELAKLRKELSEKEKIIDILNKKAQLIFQIYGEFGFCPKNKKVKDIDTKKNILNIIQEFQGKLKISEILTAISISQSRLKKWKKDVEKKPSPNENYQQSHPLALRNEEFDLLKNLYCSPTLAHFPICALHYHAKRLDILHCSINTWYKYADEYGLARPYFRHNIKDYKIGIRALSPNEIWHIDISEIKLSTGQKYYLQVVIDNFSRYCLAWQINKSKEGLNTVNLLNRAKEYKKKYTTLMMDKGGENINSNVDTFLDENKITRILAKFETDYSNSMVEAFFRSLKNNYLYFQNPLTLSSLKEKINFYCEEHNNKIPHSAHKGLTPNEVYYKMPKKRFYKDLKRKSCENIQLRQQCFYEIAS